MLRLFILRHAKSSWGQAGVPDIQRPLNERGISDLPKIAKAMAERDYQPDHIYCSSANRTQMTLNGLFARQETPPPTTFSEILYAGGMLDYLAMLTAHETSESIMVIGHNPCVHMLANHLVGHGAVIHMDELAIKYPTGTLSVVDFDVDRWEDLTHGGGSLIDFIKPRSLRD